MSMHGVKCFNCQIKGHLAANCPESHCKNENKTTELVEMIESGKELETVEKPSTTFYVLILISQLTHFLICSHCQNPPRHSLTM